MHDLSEPIPRHSIIEYHYEQMHFEDDTTKIGLDSFLNLLGTMRNCDWRQTYLGQSSEIKSACLWNPSSQETF